MSQQKKLFQKLSYLQYPFMLVGLAFCYKPFLNGLAEIWADYNMGLVFLGIGISFSTLQDTTKTQNNFSKRIYESPRKSKLFLTVILVMVIIFCVLGMWGLFLKNGSPLKDLSFGLISVGIGMIGMLKSAGEMAEYHRNKMEASDAGSNQ